MLIASVVLYLLVTITSGLSEATVPPQFVGLGFSLVGMVLGSLVPRPATEAAAHHHGGH